MARKAKSKKVKAKPLTTPRRRRAAGLTAPTEWQMVKAKIQEEVTRQVGLKGFSGAVVLEAGKLTYTHAGHPGTIRQDALLHYAATMIDRGHAVKGMSGPGLLELRLTLPTIAILRGRPIPTTPKPVAPPKKSPSPPRLRLVSSIKVPSPNSLLQPILRQLSHREYRYAELRQKLATEFDVPLKMIGVSVSDAETGEEASFDMNFADAITHLQKAALIGRAKKMVHIVPGWEAKPLPAYVPPKRRKRPRTPLPTTAKLTGDINVDRLLTSLPDKDPFSLLKMWKNAIRILGDQDRVSQHGKAAAMAAAISREWDQRASSVPDDAYFKWPHTEAPGGGRHEHYRSLRGEGMLRYLEYQVGKNGEHSSYRQALLSRIFESTLPPVFDRIYMAEWGANGTSIRLHKMAHCLASFARNFKYQDDDKFDEAIRHWEEDLVFLHDKYYVGKFGFGWPSTNT